MSIRSTILRTFIYSDVFDYPLTKDEIWRFLISEKSIKIEEFEKELASLVKFESTPLGCNHNFYYLSGREEIVEKRVGRKKTSGKKLIRAKKIVRSLSFIPTVLFVGVSGGLALDNADEKDDIDLFVIASKGNLWITRLILIFLLILMGQYRGRGKKESQKVCLNMLIDESCLEFPKERRDLYTAHEIVQLKPLFDRNETYVKFIGANKWISKFLPNAIGRIKNQEARVKEKRPLFMIHNSLFIFERLTKLLQTLYMKKHRASEVVSDHFLAFHPFDYKDFVLKEYNKRLKAYAL